jgi:dihydropyrimidine dehydrogenase (NAD+) subunit PreT
MANVFRAESVFEDKKPPLSRAEALTEANRCLYCSDAPCIQACPTAIDIPEFIRKIATDNVKGSARTIFSANILGMSCARVCPVEVLCVGACVYNEMGVQPISIGKLQRYATDIAFEHGWTFFQAGADTGKSVALIGAGPASLACAHELRRLGHAVTLYDKRSVSGGLNVTGVAPYKLKVEAAESEWEWVSRIGGITVKHHVEAGKDVSFEALEKTHDALFFGFGLGEDATLNVPGETLTGIEGAVSFIERMKSGAVDLKHVQRAVVIGGGNTALDAVRELRGLSVPEVTLVYRGSEEKMSGYVHEWDGAKVEGVRALFRRQPVRFEGDGKVSGLVVARLDDDKQRIDGSEETISADLVLMAIGQAKLGGLVAALPGVRVEQGRIITDDEGATGRPGVFAGGDCRNGGKEVVNAAAEGKRAARAIDAYFKVKHG